MTTAPDSLDDASRPVVVVWSPVDSESALAAASRGAGPAEAGRVAIVEAEDAADRESTYPDGPDVLERIAADFPGRPLLLLRAGLRLPDGFPAVLARAVELLEQQTAVAFPGNHDPRLDPFSGFDIESDRVPALVSWCSERFGVVVEAPAADCLLLAPGAARGRPADVRVDRALLLDDGYVIDPDRRPEPAPDPREVRQAPPHGHLPLRAKRLLDSAAGPVPEGDGRPVTLHVTHGWGGGVWQWIEDQIAGSPDRIHLVLVAVSDSAGRRCGLRLKLCLAGPAGGLLRELDLRPAIRSVEVSHVGYRDQLAALIDRFGVSRVVVSSLIGHGLDCLRTGLPTVVMLHDFFPLWPLLDRDPMPALEQAGGDADEARIRAAGQDEHAMTFVPADPAFWNDVAAAWRDCVAASNIRLAAPTAHVIERVRALAGDPGLEITQVAHGFRPFSDPLPTIRPPAEGPLHLVIPGRLIPGKGLGLLKRALPLLAGRVRLTALGCGKQGLELMGAGGIDLVPQYRRDELPGLVAALRPHGALLLSTVPETWSYTLSEVRALGLAPIATRAGAFAERITDGRDGVLFEPDAEALVAALEAWCDRPDALAALAARAPAERTLAEAGAALGALFGDGAAAPALPAYRAATPAETTWSWQAAKLAEATMRAESAERARDEMATELERRSRWAETMEREFRNRSAWAERLDSERQRQDRVLAEQAEVLDRQDRQYHRLSDRYGELADAHEQRLREHDALSAALSRLALRHAEMAAPIERLTERFDRLVAEHEELQRRHAALVRSHDELVRTHDELVRAHAELVGRHDALQAEHADLNRRHAALGVQHDELAHRYAQLVTEYEGMVASRSWRYTRPFRFLRRVATRRRLRQMLNPIQWFRMTRVFLFHLRFRGLRGTLDLLQNPPADAEAETIPQPTEARLPGDVAAPPEFAAVERPLVSIVIPVYNQLAFTAACLNSIAQASTDAGYEVVVVDDASGDGTWKWLRRCRNIKAIRNRKNLGFIGTCNRGAKAARGRYLVFLNNDTQVGDHWLDRLVGTFDEHEDVGVVGGKLVFADGRLQEAGGIVFRDASGWNYGRGEHPDAPDYGFVAEVDYVSGACLAIERERFSALGGFDRHFAPAYYEDTDLCFRIRQQGLKVLYQPACRVVHFEGVTSGTDESSGAKRHQVTNRERFERRWESVLAEYPENPQRHSAELARRFRNRGGRGRALVIDATTPAPDQDSGSVRMFAMLRLLSDMGFRTSFIPQNLARVERHSEALEQAGIEVVTAPWLNRIEDWLKERGEELDLVIVSRHYVLTPLLKAIRRYCPEARLVFDTVDLHFLREQREAELKGTAGAAREAERTRREELALIEASDATLVVSEFERELLERIAPGKRVSIVSNIHSVHGPGRPFEQRSGLVFVGGFQHPPNLDAAEWLIDEIFPEVRRALPDVELHIIGSKMPDSLKGRRAPGLQVHGFVEDLDPYMTGCRVSVAPLRYGAGVKGKVNQAMSHGLPVVATRCAAEGMYTVDGHDVLLADDASSFAGRIIALYDDAALWQKLADNGRLNVERHFSVAAARRQLQRVLEELDCADGDETAATGTGSG